jgi:hypothetical protein
MKTIKTNVYTYDELSDKAKEKAREWYISRIYDYDWYDFIFEEAKELGFTIEEFDLYRRECRIKLHDTPENIAKKILVEHGKDTSTYKTAQKFIKDGVKYFESEEESEEEIALNDEFKDNLAVDYLSLLQSEADYMESEEAIKEMMEANEYTFTEDGKRFA